LSEIVSAGHLVTQSLFFDILSNNESIDNGYV